MSGPARPNRGPFSRVPNPLAEALARTDLTAREHRVVWVFVRQVLGWRDRRTTNRLAIGRGELEALTGIERTNLRGIIHQLLERGILRVATPENAQNGAPTDYIFVTNPKAWKPVVATKRARRGGVAGNPTPLGSPVTPPGGVGSPVTPPLGSPVTPPTELDAYSSNGLRRRKKD